MTSHPHVLAEFVVFGLLLGTAVWGLVYVSWRMWISFSNESFPVWRRILSVIGLAAVIAQFVLFVLPWTPIGRDPLQFGRWDKWVVPAFLLAVPCILACHGKSRSRLLTSSVLLVILSSLTATFCCVRMHR